jgi:hypothetical protein
MLHNTVKWQFNSKQINRNCSKNKNYKSTPCYCNYQFDGRRSSHSHLHRHKTHLNLFNYFEIPKI